MSMDRSYLFHQYDLRSVLQGHENKMLQEIESLDGEKLHNTPIEDHVKYFLKQYNIHVPKLIEEKITVDQEETQVDVRHDFNRFIPDKSRPFYVPGTKVIFYVPFEGDAELFKCQSSRLSFNPPEASIDNQEIVISFTTTKYDAEEMRNQFNSVILQVKELLVGTSNDVGIFNESLRGKIENALKKRQEKLSMDKKLLSDLGFPSRSKKAE